MSTFLRDYTDAILYLLDYMIGIDENLDPHESELFVSRAFAMWPDDFSLIQEKIQWIAQLWKDHDREKLLEEACGLLSKHGMVERDLQWLRSMAAVDGVIDPREQVLFDHICEKLGVPTQSLALEA